MKTDTREHAKISVIVPVYNVEQYLEECVDSILAQTYPDLEIILVDDGTPDSSGQICDRYAERFPDRIKVIHKRNGGAATARNAGLDAATGQYVAFVDSDDTILPQMYTEMVAAMEAADADIVCSRLVTWHGEPRTEPTQTSQTCTCAGVDALSQIFSWRLDISPCNKLLKRNTIGSLRFPEGRTNEDFPFVTELMLGLKRVHVMSNGYYLYRVNPTSVTNNFRDSFFDIFTNLDYVRSILPTDNDKLLDDFERYELEMHIFSGLRIVRQRKNRHYKTWLRKNRAHIRRQWRRLLFDRGLSMRWRVKAAAAFLHLP